MAGMMVYISLGELLPSAYRYEKNPAVVTGSMVTFSTPVPSNKTKVQPICILLTSLW